MFIFSTQDGYRIKIPTRFHGYNFIKFIGNGSTSVVVLLEDQITKEQYSGKIMSKRDIFNRKMYSSIIREITVLKKLSHPNIVKFIEFFEMKNEDEDEFYVIVTEYCSNGDLLSYATETGFANEHDKKRIIVGFLKAIQYLHSQGISHGDIKVENILLDSNLSVKLCDFGYCRTNVFEGDDCKNGTLYYAAPELFHSGKFNTLMADIYSVGITLYSLSELQFPFIDGSKSDIVKQIVNGCLYIQNDLNKKLRNLVIKCTDLNPNNRPCIDEILKDDYLNDDCDFDERKKNYLLLKKNNDENLVNLSSNLNEYNF